MTYATAKTTQHSIGSGFGAETTAAEVIRGIDLSGKTAIVTAGYSGIGLQTTRTLLSAGAKVVVPARDLSKAKERAGSHAGRDC
jgi:3-oxoacyl-ACP reductase-like protein